MKRTASLVLAVFLLAAPVAAKTSKEQKEWMAKRDAQPLDFTLPDVESAAAWARAKDWIANYSMLPIQIADESVIQTSAGADTYDARPQLTVTRSQTSNGEWLFKVKGIVFNVFARGALDRTTHALAYYVASGIPYPPDPPKKKR